MSIAQIHTLPEPIRNLVDDARRTGEPVHIIEDGAVIARLIPEPSPGEAHSATLTDEDRLAHDLAILDNMARLAEEIGRDWPDGVSAVDAVREGRREL